MLQISRNTSESYKHENFIFYENCWHNMWKEPEIEEIKEDIWKWIEKRI